MGRIFGDTALQNHSHGHFLTVSNTDNLYYGYPRTKNEFELNIYCGFILYPDGKKEYFDRISVEKSRVISIGVGIVSHADKLQIAKFCTESDICFEDITLNMLFNSYREG